MQKYDRECLACAGIAADCTYSGSREPSSTHQSVDDVQQHACKISGLSLLQANIQSVAGTNGALNVFALFAQPHINISPSHHIAHMACSSCTPTHAAPSTSF
eukprot:GHUV01030513.1.p1 GENE.GHUV01030513.1~~GHUV01030513.1.p1  ORF type:complete len:102 (+),score=14.48 GHUV01030513.1:439-744(+)